MDTLTSALAVERHLGVRDKGPTIGDPRSRPAIRTFPGCPFIMRGQSPVEKKMPRRSWILMGALAALHLAGAQAGEVVLYSSNSVEAINAVTDEFNKKNPGIKISTVRGST